MKNVLLLILLLKSVTFYTQEKKIKLKSFSFALGGFQPYSGENGNANFYASADITANYEKNLFTSSLNRGFDIGFYNLGERYNLSFDLLYGREITIFKWLHLEFHAGIGVFRGSYYKNEGQKWKIVKNADDNKNHITPISLAFPSKFKMLFYLSEKSSFGVNINTNLNHISNLVAYNLIFQRNF
ncbi:hypothetical protein [Polaribacter sp.]|uniref:hypothetical protein n=1 Tax=Polaribacter sp. TaxID=1920175 RepID=UPI003F6C92D0